MSDFIGYSRFKFKLTKKQRLIFEPYLDLASQSAENGKFGAVSFQVLRFDSNECEVRGGFLPEEYADRICDIMQEYIERTKSEYRKEAK